LLSMPRFCRARDSEIVPREGRSDEATNRSSGRHTRPHHEQAGLEHQEGYERAHRTARPSSADPPIVAARTIARVLSLLRLAATGATVARRARVR